MKHKFKYKCYDSTELLRGCTTLSKYMHGLVSQCDRHPNRIDPEIYKGDGFEALVEVLINSSPIDKRINITGYEPWDARKHGPDMGIDGLGRSHDGTVNAVQVKFRSDVTRSLTANQDHISNFVAMACTRYPGQKIDMTIFTTAKDLHYDVSETMYNKRVRTIGYTQLTKLVDRNPAFWARFRKEMGVS